LQLAMFPHRISITASETSCLLEPLIMKTRRRELPKVNTTLESLDERVLPSTMTPLQLRHAALVQHQTSHTGTGLHPGQRHRLRAHLARNHGARAGNFATAHALNGLPTGPAAVLMGGGSRAQLLRARAQMVAAMNAAQVANPTPATQGLSVATPQTQNPSLPVSPPAQAQSLAAVPTGGLNAVNPTNPVPSATTDIGDAKNGPLAKAGQDLITIYQEFQASGGSSTFVSSKAGLIVIQGSNVGVVVNWNGTGDFNAFVTELTDLGMQVQATDARTGNVQGLLPIDQLPNVVQLPQTRALNPIYRPVLL